MEEYTTEDGLNNKKRKGIPDGNQSNEFDKVPKEVNHNSNFKWRQLKNNNKE
jgi:hypothetical protein